jgi:uncharacterized membrane protein (DUF106 family)
VSVVNGVLRAVFDALLMPFRAQPPIVGLLVVSLVAAIGMLLVFKATSNQARLDAVKRQIHACLFEIRLFSDDVPAILRAQGEILKHNAKYLVLSVVPMLWMFVPLLLVIAQLQFHYGYRGLRPGEDFVVKARLKEAPAAPARPAARLEAPAGIEVATPPVWIPSERELAWRLRAAEWGDYELKLNLDGREYSKTAQVSAQVRRRSPERLEPTFLNQLLYPAEPPLPRESPVASIALSYPEESVSFFGWHLNWLVAFFLLSIAFAFALRRRLGVTL